MIEGGPHHSCNRHARDQEISDTDETISLVDRLRDVKARVDYRWSRILGCGPKRILPTHYFTSDRTQAAALSPVK